MTSAWWWLASAHLRNGERSLAAARLPIGAAGGRANKKSAQIRLRRRRLRHTKMRRGASSNPRVLPPPLKSHQAIGTESMKRSLSEGKFSRSAAEGVRGFVLPHSRPVPEAGQTSRRPCPACIAARPMAASMLRSRNQLFFQNSLSPDKIRA